MRRAVTLSCAVFFLIAGAAAAGEAKIVVGPNYLVSRDGDLPHAETMIAANPLDVANLVGGAITYTRPEGGWAVRSYATRDGGATWHWSDFPEQVEHGGGDPQVVFTPDGAAVFAALTFGGARDELDRERGGMQVYRSEDGGLSWRKTQDICCSNDHPQMAVDRSVGRFAGRIYIATLAGYPEYKVQVFRSDDGGRTFHGPVTAASGGGVKGINVVTPVVLSDGTLYVPYVDFEFRPEKVKEVKARGKASTGVWYVTSNDGGLTFSKPRQNQTLEIDLSQPNVMEGLALPYTAVDAASVKYRDRLYRVWAQFRDGKPRVFFSHSADRGATWGPPRTLPAEPPADSRQFQPALAVNQDGTVGVTWFDTRDSSDGSQYHLYFAASPDGGATFLPPVRVSSAPSTPGGRGNSVPAGMTWPAGGDTIELSFLSAASRWSTGGDYLGLTANRRGVFYPLWTDARSGTYQLYTAAIRVELPPPPAPADPEEAKRDAALARPEEPRSRPEQRQQISLAGKVEFIFDPTIYDAASGTVELPLRLKNTSNYPIYPPLTLEIVALGSGWEEEPAKRPPQMLNADNGEAGVGARFTLDGALGGDAVLAPGMLSGPVPLRFRVFFDPLASPSVQFKIHGQVDGAAAEPSTAPPKE